jgi:hypothetical protein
MQLALSLGFDPARLLLARIDLGEIAQNADRRDRVLRELHARIQRIPGVEAATFSQLGLFSGGISTAAIEVRGGAVSHPQSRLRARSGGRRVLYDPPDPHPARA